MTEGCGLRPGVHSGSNGPGEWSGACGEGPGGAISASAGIRGRRHTRCVSGPTEVSPTQWIIPKSDAPFLVAPPGVDGPPSSPRRGTSGDSSCSISSAPWWCEPGMAGRCRWPWAIPGWLQREGGQSQDANPAARCSLGLGNKAS